MSSASLSSPSHPTKPPRLDSVDLLRGVIMVIMALDHVRDMISNTEIDPFDFQRTSVWLCLTRWITHFCAPNFIFLAGTGAFLGMSRGKSKPEMARLLWTRGLWLIFLDMTAVRFGWAFNFDFSFNFMMILWPIGFAMIVLSALVRFSAQSVGLLGVAIICLHNLTDGVKPEAFGSLGWVWKFLHAGGVIQITPSIVFIPFYALLPWFGVMAAGYGFGSLLQLERKRRREVLLRLGLGLCAAFVVLRGINLYGDPKPWATQKSPMFTILSFLNCEKYPPSLLYNLMTIGPGIVFIALADRPLGKFAQFFITFGRVPMFYYLIHAPLIHLMAVICAWPKYQIALGSFLASAPRPGYGLGLGVIYLLWILAVLILYLPCRWFAELKRHRKDAWLSYI